MRLLRLLYRKNWFIQAQVRRKCPAGVNGSVTNAVTFVKAVAEKAVPSILIAHCKAFSWSVSAGPRTGTSRLNGNLTRICLATGKTVSADVRVGGVASVGE
jgi:hypothetical protein